MHGARVVLAGCYFGCEYASDMLAQRLGSILLAYLQKMWYTTVVCMGIFPCDVPVPGDQAR